MQCAVPDLGERRQRRRNVGNESAAQIPGGGGMTLRRSRGTDFQ
jgi:hypothetical protein